MGSSLLKPGSLQKRWSLLWPQLNLSESAPSVLCNLLDRYAEPHRAYHTAQHLCECLRWFDAACHLAKNPAAVELAIWFHDVVYDPHSADNEEQSADLAVEVIQRGGGSFRLQESVYDLILATRHSAEPTSDDTRLVVDIDLSILGAPPSRFMQYEAQIRQEYAWVPEDVFRTKRADVIEAFMARPSIFALDFFQTRLEHQAQHNLRTLALPRQFERLT